MSVVMPVWLVQTLSVIETIVAGALILVALKICYKYPEFVFKKIPMASLYIISFIGIVTTIFYVWTKPKNAKLQLGLYFLD